MPHRILLPRIDTRATARFLGLAPGPLDPSDLLVPLHFVGRALLNHAVHPARRLVGDDRVLYAERVRRRLPIGPRPILLRVDDYPRADFPTSRFFEFARIFADHGVQMLLGVTPLLDRDGRRAGLTDEEVRWLVDASARGEVRIAAHGTTHRNLRPDGGPHATTELVGVPPDRLRASIARGFESLVNAGLPRPLHYIPPFNSIDAAAYAALADTYPYLHGGALSIDTLGAFSPGTVIGTAAWFPCYLPWYARARELVDQVAREPDASSDAWHRRTRFPLVLTLHWAWETEDNFRGARRLAIELASRGGRWEEWERFGAWPRSAQHEADGATLGVA